MVARNPDYYRVAFLADATGQANGTGYTTDESRHAWPLTYNGDAAIASGKFEFDGVGDFIEVTNSLLWTPGSMLTLEVLGLEFDAVNTGTAQGIVGHYSADVGAIGWVLYENSGTLTLGWSTTGSSTDNTLNIASVSAATPYDVALCWDGATVFVLLNGVVEASVAFTGTFFHAATTLRLGCRADAAVEQEFLNGRFACVMLTRGECLYEPSGAQEMPSLPRTVDTPTLTDALWPNVMYLVAYDEALGRIRDLGPLDLPITVVGNAAGNATGSVSGSPNTIDTDGAGDYLSIPDDALTRIQDGTDFCFDAVLKTTDLSHINTITAKKAPGVARDAALVMNGPATINLFAWNSSNSAILVVNGGSTLSANTEYHFAGSLSGTSGRVFVDGVQDGSATKSGTIGNTTASRLLGRDASNTARDFEGQWAWLRCTKGNARYTAGFTPPTGVPPIGAVSGATIEPPLLTAEPTLYAPTVTSGALVVEPPLLTATPTLFAPTVQPGALTLTAPLLTNTATLYAPTIATGATIEPPLLTAEPTLYAPTIATGAVTASPPLLTVTPTLYAPTLTPTYVLSPPLLTNAVTLYAPTIATGAVTASPPLLTATPTLFAPTIATDAVTASPPLLTNAVTLYAPTLTPTYVLSPPLLNSFATLLVPEVLTALTIDPPLLVATPTLFAPEVQPGTVTVTVPLLTLIQTSYTPVITVGVTTVSPPLLDASATLYEPEMELRGTLSMPRLTNVVQLFAPSVTAAYDITTPLLNAGASLLAPTVAIGSIERRLRVGSDVRSQMVTAQARSVYVEAQDRTVTVAPAESRVVTVLASGRSLEQSNLDRAA